MTQLGGRARIQRRTPRWIAELAPAGPARRAPVALEPAPAQILPERRAFPNRYRIRRDGRERILTCLEAPTVWVRLRRGVSVGAAAARSALPGSIFLDGAAQGEPFLDPERAVYNLDHHEGCVRLFTLATCEQAMVLIRKRLDLRRRDWTVFANDADLDTVLAIWVLLNHLRLTDEDPRARAAIMPLLRLEGSIDALGLELQDLCALPPDLLARTHAQMRELRAKELALHAEGRWETLDLLPYVVSQLQAIDRLVYPPEDVEGVAEIEELARREIARGSLAVVCRSKVGIYEVERQLRRVHGERLGLIALQKAPSTYSLRQVDPALPGGTLEPVYARLNLVDPASHGSRSPNRWGGSDEIGGSPRAAGTRLTPAQIAAACGDAHARPSWRGRAARVGRAGLLAAALLGLALAPDALRASGFAERAFLDALALDPALCFGAALLALAGLGLLVLGPRAPGVYGMRRPAGLDWWACLPVAVVGALAGGVWRAPVSGGALEASTLAALLGLPVAVELLFRGLVQGSLVGTFAVQRAGGRWFVSAPALVSSALYAVACGLPPLAALSSPGPWSAAHPGVPLAGAFGFALAAAAARERSESVIAPILFHWIGVGAVLGAASLGA
jgi:hypothetical protein